jgi:hypothetical protein
LRGLTIATDFMALVIDVDRRYGAGAKLTAAAE